MRRILILLASFVLVGVGTGYFLISDNPQSSKTDQNAETLQLITRYFKPDVINAAQGIKAYGPSRAYPNGLILLANGYLNSLAAFDLSFNPIFIKPYDDGVHKAGLMADVVKISETQLAFTGYRSNSIVVTDSIGNVVNSIGRKGNGETEFLQPIGIELTKSGNLVVADYRNHRIQLLTPDGQFIRSWGSEENTELTYDVCVYDNEIFLSDRKNNRFQVFDEAGSTIRTFTLAADHIPLNNNQHCDFDSLGNLYVADTNNQRIVQFTQDGKFLKSFTFGEFGIVRGLAIGHDNKIYATGMVADNNGEFQESNAGVWVFKPVL